MTKVIYNTVHDDDQFDADTAVHIFMSHPQFRKVFTAQMSLLMDEINLLRAFIQELQVDASAGGTPEQFQAKIATYDSLLPRTASQYQSQIQSRISKDT